MSKTILVSSRHHLFVKQISRAELPANLPHSENYKKFYVVKNWDDTGVTFFYLGKGNDDAPAQIVAWYANTGSMWSGYGTSMERALEGAMRDGWMYA